MNEKSAVITSAGAASGSMILKKGLDWLHPSILPASPDSRGSCRNTFHLPDTERERGSRST